MEMETIKKSQRETILKIENLGKRSGVKDASITNRIQEIEESISGPKVTIENIDTTVKENAKCKKLLTKNIEETQDTMRPKLIIIDTEKSEDSQIKGPVIINKIIEETFSNLNKDMPMNIQEAYRTPNRLHQERNSSRHIKIKTPNALNKEKIIKTVRGKDQVTYIGKHIRITPNFSPETMKTRRSWADVIQTLREYKCQPRQL
jgi:U3 small nucleolar ribonucleoprotein component